MKTILEEILNEATEISAFSSADDLFETLQKEWPKFLKQRIAKKIPVKVITRATPKGLERQNTGLKELREVRLVSEDLDFHGITMLWKNKIAMFSLKNELTALVIENKEMLDIQKAMFVTIWDRLPRYQKN